MNERGSGIVSMLLLGGLLASCFVRRGDPTRFYVLTPTTSPPRSTPGSLGIGLGPIAMPGYLRRPMLARRVDGTQVRYADFDRWAEPLPDLFTRTLGQDLSALLDAARIVPYPWYPAAALDLVVRIDVTAFEADVRGSATLEACWTIRDRHTGTVRRDECSSMRETVGQEDAEREVAALSRTVGELAERIAGAIRDGSTAAKRTTAEPSPRRGSSAGQGEP